jgi:hypothetical protein
MNFQILKIHRNIEKAIRASHYDELGVVEIVEESTLEILKLRVNPHDGIHTGLDYIVSLHFREADQWPTVHIDSSIFDKIKTSQYVNNKGCVGDHKGICIKNLSHSYAFPKHFKNYCDNKWENYVKNIIVFFNYPEDIEKGNGIRSNYKEILGVH